MTQFHPLAVARNRPGRLGLLRPDRLMTRRHGPDMHPAILPTLLVALSPAWPGAESGGDPCVSMLDNLSRTAEAQGYTLFRATATLQGDDGAENAFDARCDPQHGRIVLAATDGSRVRVDLVLSPLGSVLEIDGDFPGVGSVARTVLLPGAPDDGLTGFLTASADVGTERAVAEYDFRSGAWKNTGDAAETSSILAPVLGTSKIWSDGHVFALALSGAWDRVRAEAGAADQVLRVMLDAVPDDSRMSEADKDTFKKCLGTGAVCGLAVLLKFGFGSGAACWTSGGLCVAAAACSLSSECSKD